MSSLYAYAGSQHPACRGLQQHTSDHCLGQVHMQVQALRAVEQHLGLEKLYVLGTNCVDNGPRKGLEKFLNAASTQPDTVSGYEFMQA